MVKRNEFKKRSRYLAMLTALSLAFSNIGSCVNMVYAAEAESQENGSGITESSGNSTGDWCPAIMVDGQLYWSSGQVLSSVGESAILGTTTYTDGVPDQDGQANFDREGTRYARTDGGIAVEMDGEWVLFTTKGP